MAQTTEKNSGRQRPGPKPRGPFEDKQATLTTRITASTRRRLDEAAEASGLSLSQEVERRLERSFQEDALSDDILKERWGDKLTYRLMKILAIVKMMIESKTGKSFQSDWETYFAVQQGWQRMLSALAPPKPEGWDEKHRPPTPQWKGGLLGTECTDEYLEAAERYEPLPQLGSVTADALLQLIDESARKEKKDTRKKRS